MISLNLDAFEECATPFYLKQDLLKYLMQFSEVGYERLLKSSKRADTMAILRANDKCIEKM